jgi:hypothetical protein
MYVVKRITNNEAFDTKINVTHETYLEAIEEAERLAAKEIDKDCCFHIYELKPITRIEARIEYRKTQLETEE